MSIRALTWVMHESDSTGNNRLVLLMIADECDDDGTGAYPGHDRIAHKARVSVDTSQRAVDRLEAAGELLVKRPPVKGRGRHNFYVVVMGRNPLELAQQVGWPAPALDEHTRAKWPQVAAIPPAPLNGRNPQGEWPQPPVTKAAPVRPDPALRPVDPERRGRRGVREPDLVAAANSRQQAAARALEERNAEALAELAATPRSPTTELVAGIGQARAALQAALAPDPTEQDRTA